MATIRKRNKWSCDFAWYECEQTLSVMGKEVWQIKHGHGPSNLPPMKARFFPFSWIWIGSVTVLFTNLTEVMACSFPSPDPKRLAISTSCLLEHLLRGTKKTDQKPIYRETARLQRPLIGTPSDISHWGQLPSHAHLICEYSWNWVTSVSQEQKNHPTEPYPNS